MPTNDEASRVLRVRLAGRHDSADILRWRNDTHTRAMSIEPGVIAADRHETWYQTALASSEKLWLIGECAGKKVGVVRFDRRTAAQWEVSITIAPEVRNYGHGKQLLAAAISCFHDRCPQTTVLARIKACNEASVRLFTALGFGPANRTAADAAAPADMFFYVKYFS